MTVVFFPLLLVCVGMLLAAALVALASLGPAGWVLDVALVVGLVIATRWSWARARRWWASTKAPELPPSGWF